MNAGRKVTTHEKVLSYKGWRGAGYIIIDPNSGAGAYLIEGGANGGVGYINGALIGSALLIAAISFDVKVGKASLYLHAAMLGLLAGLIVGTVIIAAVQRWGDTEKGCLILGFLHTFAVSGAVRAYSAQAGKPIGGTATNLITAMVGLLGLQYTFSGSLPKISECI